jgi:putative transposase
MTVREIQGFLADMYGIEVSPDLISTVTDGIVAEVTAWQTRPRTEVSGRALRCPAREDSPRGHGGQQSRVFGSHPARRDARHPRPLDRADGGCQVLDEGLHRLEDARVPGLAHRGHGWPEGDERALAAIYLQTTLQTGILHLQRHSLDYASWKERLALAAAL